LTTNITTVKIYKNNATEVQKPEHRAYD